jgi:site-specific recombinase XerD
MSSEFPFFEAPHSERLQLWRRAFEDYIAERRTIRARDAVRKSITIWRDFLQETKRLPWEVDEELIKSYIDAELAKGKKPSTVNRYKFELSVFYDWCSEHDCDVGCGHKFNPTRNVASLKYKQTMKADLLTESEARRLLEVIRKEPSIVSRRDYAITLARLLLGDPTSCLVQMKWGNLQFKGDEAWWSYEYRGRKIERQLPAAVWQAIQEYLDVSGRLTEIEAGDYIFAPLKDGFLRSATGKSEEWKSRHYIKTELLWRYMQRFMQLTKIRNKKISLASLKHTAVILRFNEGATFEELMDFTISDSTDATSWYIRALYKKVDDKRVEKLTKEATRDGEEWMGKEGLRWDYPPLSYNRQSPHSIPGHNAKHGFYRKVAIPDELLTKVMSDGAGDLGEEIQGLQEMSAQLYQMSGGIKHWAVHLALAQTYSDAVSRLTRMMKIQEQYLQPHNARWLQEAHQIVTRLVEAGEMDPVELEKFPWENLAQPQVDGEGGDRIRLESIACLRLMMRQALENAPKLKKANDFARLVDKYSQMGVKLAHLIALQAGGKASLDQARERTIAEAMRISREDEE